MSQLTQGVAGASLAVITVLLAWTALPAMEPAVQPETAPERVAQPSPATGETWPKDVASYTLRASLDPDAHEIRADGVIEWVNASNEPQRELYVHLYLNAFKNEHTVMLRRQAAGFRGAGELDAFGWIDVTRFEVREWGEDVWPDDAHTPGDERDETDIRVPLPRDVAPGERITIDVAWHSKLPEVLIRTGYMDRFHMVAQWFPKIARLEPDGQWAHFPFQRYSEFYADYGTYDVTIDVPQAFVVGATGHLEEERESEGRREMRYVQEHVHDFAFVAWDEFEEKTAASETGVALRCLYPPGYDDAAELQLSAAKVGLEKFGQRYGRYPYGTLTLVHPPGGAREAGGMEYPTLITTGGSWYSPYLGVRGIEHVTVHELGHQWFYGILASNENAHPFLDEGLNSYADSSVLETMYPGASLFDGFGFRISTPAGYRVFSNPAAHFAPVAQAADSFVTGSDYGRLVYARTATLLHTLRRVYGPSVDRALGRYARAHRFGHPDPEDLLAAVEAEVGQEAAVALREGLFERGWVDFIVESATSSAVREPRGVFGPPRAPRETPSAQAGASHRGSVVLRRKGTLVLPVDVELVGEDGTVTRGRWSGDEPSFRMPYAGESPLASVVVDPDHRVLVDEDLFNNAWRRERPAMATRVLERTAFAAAALMMLGAP